MPDDPEAVEVLERILHEVQHDERLGREAAGALERGCTHLLRVAFTGDASGARLVAEQTKVFVAGVRRVLATERKRDQRGPARTLAQAIERAVKRWETERAKGEAQNRARWLHPWVWDGILRAWRAVDEEFAADRVPRSRRSKASFLSVLDGARDTFRRVVAEEALQYQSNEPEHVVVDGEPLRDQLIAAGRLEIDDILLALYFPASRATLSAGLDDDDLELYDAVVCGLDDGASGFGPVAATHVILGEIVDKSPNTVEKTEKAATRGEVCPPSGDGERGTPENPWALVQRRRVGSQRGRSQAERRPDSE
ncbi:MAG: hypothetical protein AAF799_21855 [Myxococcota bacterium]